MGFLFGSSNGEKEKKLDKKILKLVSDAYFKVFGKKLKQKDVSRLFNLLEEKIYEKSGGKEWEIAKKLFEYGKTDLLASEILWDRKIYPLAVYLLQQSIEKITKGYFLGIGFITIEELYPLKTTKKQETIGHISPKAFLLALKKKEVRESVDILFRHSGIKQEEVGGPRDLEKLIKRPIKLARISEKEINYVLRNFKAKHKIIKRVIGGRNLRFKINLYKTSILSRIHRIKISKKDKKTLKEGLNYLGVDTIKNLELNFLLLNMYLLSIITFPHFISTRYPKGKRGLCPEDYTEDLGIVKKFPKILEMTKSIIKGLENRFFKQ